MTALAIIVAGWVLLLVLLGLLMVGTARRDRYEPWASACHDEDVRIRDAERVRS